MGLVQRAIESAGIATIGITLARDVTARVMPPRSVFLHWPFGHPLGEPGATAQQRAVLLAAFEALYTIDVPGTIVDLPWRWRREDYSAPAPLPDLRPRQG